MKSVTITLDDDLVRRARIAATAEAQSLSRFIRETVERQVDCQSIPSTAVVESTVGPPLDLHDETDRASPRDRACE